MNNNRPPFIIITALVVIFLILLVIGLFATRDALAHDRDSRGEIGHIVGEIAAFGMPEITGYALGLRCSGLIETDSDVYFNLTGNKIWELVPVIAEFVEQRYKADLLRIDPSLYTSERRSNVVIKGVITAWVGAAAAINFMAAEYPQMCPVFLATVMEDDAEVVHKNEGLIPDNEPEYNLNRY